MGVNQAIVSSVLVMLLLWHLAGIATIVGREWEPSTRAGAGLDQGIVWSLLVDCFAVGTRTLARHGLVYNWQGVLVGRVALLGGGAGKGCHRHGPDIA